MKKPHVKSILSYSKASPRHWDPTREDFKQPTKFTTTREIPVSTLVIGDGRNNNRQSFIGALAAILPPPSEIDQISYNAGVVWGSTCHPFARQVFLSPPKSSERVNPARVLH